MVLKKKIREKGKIKLSRFFQKFEKGDNVIIDIESSLKVGFPKRIQGRVGKIEEKKGRAYVVNVKDQKKEKRYLVQPIHLKKTKK